MGIQGESTGHQVYKLEDKCLSCSEQKNTAGVNSMTWVIVHRTSRERMINLEIATVDHSMSPSSVKFFLWQYQYLMFQRKMKAHRPCLGDLCDVIYQVRNFYISSLCNH